MGRDERIGSFATPSPEPGVLPLDALTVRPSALVRDVRARLRDLGDDGPDVVHVTTPRGRHLGSVEVAALLRRAPTA